MEHKKFNPKDIIFTEGEATKEAYIIVSGKIEILKRAEHGDVQLAVLEEGALFGEMSILEKRAQRSASARALTEATLEVIGGDDLARMVSETPKPLITIIYNLFDRLKETNARLASRERATTLLHGDLEQIIISAAADSELEGVFEPVTIKIANLPFTIGGYQKDTEDPPKTNLLDLPCEGPPLKISQKHCIIRVQDDGVYLVDSGSRFCTIVNSKVIGRGKVDTKAPLVHGTNTITLGDHTSLYKLIIEAS